MASMFGTTSSSPLSSGEDRFQAQREERRRALLDEAFHGAAGDVAGLGGVGQEAMAALASSRGARGGAAFGSSIGLGGVGGSPFAGIDVATELATSQDAFYRTLAALAGPVAGELAASDREAFAGLQDRLADLVDEQTRLAVTSNPWRRFLLGITGTEDPLA